MHPVAALKLIPCGSVGIIKRSLVLPGSHRHRWRSITMGPLGMGEIIVLFILALLMFGPKKLPELGKTFGKGMAEFKRASNELKTTFQREMDNIEHETKDVKTLARDVKRGVTTSYYDDNEDDYYNDYDYDGSQSGTVGAGSTSTTSKQGEADDAGADATENSALSEDAGSDASADTAGDDAVTVAVGTSAEPVSDLPESEQPVESKSA